MSASTPKYVIPYSVGTDAVATVDDTMQALAQRLDLLLGEAGQVSFTGAAATTLNAAVSLARTYPGNSGAAVPGIVLVQPTSVLGSANVQNWWVDTWTGTGTTITGFTIHLQSSNAPSARLFNWRFLPVL